MGGQYCSVMENSRGATGRWRARPEPPLSIQLICARPDAIAPGVRRVTASARTPVLRPFSRVRAGYATCPNRYSSQPIFNSESDRHQSSYDLANGIDAAPASRRVRHIQRLQLAGAFRADRFEPRLLLVVERSIEIVERRTHRRHRLQHDPESLTD